MTDVPGEFHFPNVNLALVIAAQLAVFRQHPDGADGIFANRNQVPFALASPDLQRLDFSLRDEGGAGGVSSNPQIAAAVLEQSDDFNAGQCDRILIENGESNAVESNHAVEGSEPKITVTRASQGKNRVIWKQSLARPPGIDAKTPLGDLGFGLFRSTKPDGKKDGNRSEKHVQVFAHEPALNRRRGTERPTVG